MTWIKRVTSLKIRHKIVVAPLLAALAFVAIQVVDYRANQTQEALLQEISEGRFPALETSRELRETLSAIQRSLQDAVAAQDRSILESAHGLAAQFDQLVEAARENPIRETETIDALAGDFEAYFALSTEVVNRMIGGEMGEELVTDIQAMTSRYNAIRDALDEGMIADKAAIEAAFETTHESQRRTRAINLAVAVTCIMLLVPATIWVIRSVTIPLRGLLGVAERLAASDLSVVIPENQSRDEIAHLHNAFRGMSGSLREVLGNVSTSVRELSSSAAEISATAQQSATTATQQSSTAAEVSTSVDEIQHTSKSATAQAREVVSVAEDALEKGQQGLEAIAEAVGSMETIGDRVEGLAQKILGLNEKNAEIAQIVDTVNELAEQSNLLAVNASIEAAKAGEQGRGFAVVSTEVRRLASQSKRATQKIASILGEVRSASESAVMATEETCKRTDEGQRSIESVREVVQGLASVLEESADRARQISGANSQQAAGISQIAEAMESVATGSRDSASGAQQLEKSAMHINTLAEQLHGITQSFSF